MAGPSVHISAARTNRSLTAAAEAPARRRLVADPTLKYWRWLINSAASDAKRTKGGLPTYDAIIARWWIAQNNPPQSDREAWGRSFPCACSWLDLDLGKERSRLLKAIDAALDVAFVTHMRALAYERSAMVLTAIGIDVAVSRQRVLPFVTEQDVVQDTELDFPDPANAFKHFVGLRAA